MLDLVDPGLECLDFKRKFNIAGIINAKSEAFVYGSNGSSCQRISVITPHQTQMVVDIWTASEQLQPVFAKDWKIGQYIVLGKTQKKIVKNRP